MTVAIGSVLAGRYRLEASIGRGGMGEVFAATHVHTGKALAVKIVRRAFVTDVHMQRLHREAVAAGRIQSPFVPQVFDVDRSDEGELFLVMELLRGETLGERLRARGGALPWREVRAFGEDVLSGLVDAHAAGVVHRDLKPANVFLETSTSGGQPTPRARVLDFGVCKLDGPDIEKLTTTGESVGTVAYMAPEQIRGAASVDERADLYAFGLLVFEALSGELPYEATGQIALLAEKLERPAVSLGARARESYPPALEGLVARLLARRPEGRPASAAEVLAAWRALGAPSWVPDARSETAKVVLVPNDVDLTTASVPSAHRARGSRVGLAVAAVTLVGALAALVVAVRPSARDASAVSAAPSPAVPSANAPLPSLADAPPVAAPATTGTAALFAAPDDGGTDVRPASAPAHRPAPRRRTRVTPAPPAPRGGAAPRIATEPRY